MITVELSEEAKIFAVENVITRGHNSCRNCCEACRDGLWQRNSRGTKQIIQMIQIKVKNINKTVIMELIRDGEIIMILTY